MGAGMSRSSWTGWPRLEAQRQLDETKTKGRTPAARACSARRRVASTLEVQRRCSSISAVGELGGDVMDGVEAVLGEDALEESGVAEVALDAGEAGERVLVGLEVDVDYGVAFAEESRLRTPPKKPEAPVTSRCDIKFDCTAR